MDEKKLLSGNEAVARGAYEAGCRFATSYPGTPSTEILETVLREYSGINAQWATNEKVALEVGYGACLAGARTLVTMKQVGLNVAADPFFTISYTGVNGGLVIVSADEPGVHSSQNEQDNRNYAKFAKIPMLEPSDSQEALEFTKYGFALSEEFDTPVLLRLTTRICHGHSVVYPGKMQDPTLKEYKKDWRKRAMVPANALARHPEVEKRLCNLKQASESSPLNDITWKSSDVGIITSGVAYFHALEAFPQYSILKLGFSYPLPEAKIKDFTSKVKQVYLIEENDPFLEEQVRALCPSVEIHGKDLLPVVGELTPETIRVAFKGKTGIKKGLAQDALRRLPVFCPGCPHRGSFYLTKKYARVITGDIGCYGLAALPPLECMDTIICMGASVGMAEGFSKVRPLEKVLGVIGDSTFYHSGVTGLLDIYFNSATSKLVILDNSTTAMTGHQPNPGSPVNSRGEPRGINLEALVGSIGINVKSLDPLSLKDSARELEQIMNSQSGAVVIFKSPCILLPEVAKNKKSPFRIDQAACVNCKACLKLLCPALEAAEKPLIREFMCAGCGLCAQVCPKSAISGVKAQ
ncbi:MAG: indolepyruvate ferredoxin oxidoreductase subunit alpha [Candidatus Wallbacteria bacterium]|nr:indolepyruvate ferredoxin oxidoreductase subunit alpha [Candidatus Wallbacteria bacterium]